MYLFKNSMCYTDKVKNIKVERESMMIKKVLLICGSGASSGFMAAAIRKAAKTRNKELVVKATSEAQLGEHLDAIDCLLIGPHLSYMVTDLKNRIQDKNISIEVIPQMVYGTLDGNKALDLIINMEN